VAGHPVEPRGGFGHPRPAGLGWPNHPQGPKINFSKKKTWVADKPIGGGWPPDLSLGVAKATPDWPGVAEPPPRAKNQFLKKKKKKTRVADKPIGGGRPPDLSLGVAGLGWPKPPLASNRVAGHPLWVCRPP
jgi:hypothetical protein